MEHQHYRQRSHCYFSYDGDLGHNCHNGYNCHHCHNGYKRRARGYS